MARKRRRAVAAAAPGARHAGDATPSGAAGEAPASPGWRWRTFPVFFALATGLLVASFVNGRPANGAAAALQIAALLGFGYGLAHLFVTNVIVAGRVRRRRQARQRGEVQPDDFEDELVYSDEAGERSRTNQATPGTSHGQAGRDTGR